MAGVPGPKARQFRRCGTGGHKGRPYERIGGGAALIAGLLVPAVRFGGVWALRPSVSKKSFRHAGRIFKLSKKFKNTCRLNAKGAFCPLHTSPAALSQTSSARFFDSLWRGVGTPPYEPGRKRGVGAGLLVGIENPPRGWAGGGVGLRVRWGLRRRPGPVLLLPEPGLLRQGPPGRAPGSARFRG